MLVKQPPKGLYKIIFRRDTYKNIREAYIDKYGELFWWDFQHGVCSRMRPPEEYYYANWQDIETIILIGSDQICRIMDCRMRLIPVLSVSLSRPEYEALGDCHEKCIVFNIHHYNGWIDIPGLRDS